MGATTIGCSLISFLNSFGVETSRCVAKHPRSVARRSDRIYLAR
jgi:hypothetical protein